jgi:hypothetical protein
MNEGQAKFYSFILERVQNGKEHTAKAMLEESFAKQVRWNAHNGIYRGVYP